MTWVCNEFTWNSRRQLIERPVKEFKDRWEAEAYAQKFPSIIIRAVKERKPNYVASDK